MRTLVQVQATSSADAATTLERPIRSFHARRSRIRPSARDALARLWPQWGVDLNDGFEFDEYFAGFEDIVLEIGCGMGDATVAMGQADRSTAIFAVDVHTPGLGVLLRDCERGGLSNVRVAACDAVTLLSNHIPPGSLAGIRIYFPDPWPKQRQHKRRLVQSGFISMAASRLRPSGTLHTATDWQDYADQMLAVLTTEPSLQNEFGGFAPRPLWRPLTRFESKGLAAGHSISDLLFRKL